MTQSSSRWSVRLKLTVLAINIFSFSTLSAAPISGQGTWESTLQARDLDGNMSSIEAYYDTTLGITWLADANLAKTVFSSGSSVAPNNTDGTPSVTLLNADGTPTVTLSFADADYTKSIDGLMNLTQATAWANDLNFNGISGWRLPFNKIVNDSPLTEITHLYTSTLGNSLLTKVMRQVGSSGSGVTQYSYETVTIRDGGRGNTGPFLNINLPQTNAGIFWSANPQGLDAFFDDSAFSWDTGYTAQKSQVPNAIAWIVHDGDIGIPSQVPEPQTWALMLLGLSAVAFKCCYAKRSNPTNSIFDIH